MADGHGDGDDADGRRPPACRKGAWLRDVAQQVCQMCEIFLLFMERWLISVIVFSPAISPRQKFD
jgi:hypothetical protein